ncbi:hypothetical protein Taro_042670 [Colocasia esculenta]|uniref:Photosynthetic NDH subcomplex L 3 n=1 Tax=Colocasia esculenta TaxID=4460 RepID=A0A843WHG6_COLES|nr:hypothetical protein [Colocasia esculenta]
MAAALARPPGASKPLTCRSKLAPNGKVAAEEHHSRQLRPARSDGAPCHAGRRAVLGLATAAVFPQVGVGRLLAEGEEGNGWWLTGPLPVPSVTNNTKGKNKWLHRPCLAGPSFKLGGIRASTMSFGNFSAPTKMELSPNPPMTDEIKPPFHFLIHLSIHKYVKQWHVAEIANSETGTRSFLRKGIFMANIGVDGSAYRLKQYAFDLLALEDMVGQDTWSYMRKYLCLKSTVMYYDFDKVITAAAAEQKQPLTDLANRLFDNVEKLEEAVKKQSLPLTESSYADTKAVLQDVMTRMA